MILFQRLLMTEDIIYYSFFLTMAQGLQLFCRYKRLNIVLRQQISVGSFSSSHRRTSCSRCTILLMSSQKRLLSNDPAVFGEKGHTIIPSRICPKKDLTTREYIPSDSLCFAELTLTTCLCQLQSASARGSTSQRTQNHIQYRLQCSL